MAKLQTLVAAVTISAVILATLLSSGSILQAAPQPTVAPLPTVIATITVGTGDSSNGPEGIAVDPNRNYIYVANSKTSRVYVIDGNSNAVIAEISDSRLSAPWGLGVNPVTRRIYVANNARNSVVVIDGNSNSVITEIFHGSLNYPDQVLVDPATNRIFVSNSVGGLVSVIDGAINGVVTAFSAGVPQPHNMVLDAARNRLYVGNLFFILPTPVDYITAINATTYTEIGRRNALAGTGGLAVRAVDGRVYVAQSFSDTTVYRVAVVNPTDFSFAYPFPGIQVNGKRLAGAVYSSGTDRVFVNGFDSNTVDVIDAATNTVIATLPVGANPASGIAYNPATGRVYVANRGNGTVTVIQDGAAGTPVPTPTLTPEVTPTPTVPPCYRDALEPDDSIAEAKVLNLAGFPVQHNICPAGDQDWHSLNIFTVPMTLTVRTFNLLNDADTVLYLYYTDGSTLLAWDDDSGGGKASRLQYTFTKVGTYYILVRDYDATAFSTYRRYQIVVEGGPGYPSKANLPVVLSTYP